MSLMKSYISDDVLVEQDCISIPVGLFEDLIRAETECEILAAAIEGSVSYLAGEVLAAIKEARKKHLRGLLHIEIGDAPPADPEPSDENPNTAAESQEDPDGTESCE